MLEYAASDVALLLRLGKAMYLDLVQKSVSLPGSSVSATTNMWEVAARASQLRVNGTFKVRRSHFERLFKSEFARGGFLLEMCELGLQHFSEEESVVLYGRVGFKGRVSTA
ncbi:hypothetical protein SARC_15968, partial [Sphaeroforma arctica JP610]